MLTVLEVQVGGVTGGCCHCCATLRVAAALRRPRVAVGWWMPSSDGCMRQCKARFPAHCFPGLTCFGCSSRVPVPPSLHLPSLLFPLCLLLPRSPIPPCFQRLLQGRLHLVHTCKVHPEVEEERVQVSRAAAMNAWHATMATPSLSCYSNPFVMMTR